MRVSDVMTRVPLTADPSTSAEEVAALVEAGNIHHLPLVDGEDVVGLWLATDEGPAVLLSADKVGRVDVDDPAEEAVEQLLDEQEIVVAWEDHAPVGVLTRTDLKRVLHLAMERGYGRRSSVAPVIIRFFGEAGAGKTTLILRTIPRLKRWQSGVVEACTPTAEDGARSQVEGTPIVFDEDAHHRSALPQVVEGLGPVDVVLFEDRGRPTVLDHELGESLRVLAVAWHDVEELEGSDLENVEAVVVTKLDAAPPELDFPAMRRAITEATPGVEVFGVAAATDDRGLAEWQAWLEGECLPHLNR